MLKQGTEQPACRSEALLRGVSWPPNRTLSASQARSAGYFRGFIGLIGWAIQPSDRRAMSLAGPLHVNMRSSARTGPAAQPPSFKRSPETNQNAGRSPTRCSQEKSRCAPTHLSALALCSKARPVSCQTRPCLPTDKGGRNPYGIVH